ncbi:MAG: hypothetical protein ACE5GU_02325 [Candidatus Scalinduaceae bacterium]
MQEGKERNNGKENRSDKLPEKLRSKESKLKAIKEAYNKLKKQKKEMKAKIKKEKAVAIYQETRSNQHN